MDRKTRPELPVELYTHTLNFLPLEDASTLRTLHSVLSTSTYLRAAASSSLVWKPIYKRRYTQCVPAHEARRRAQFGDDYFRLFVERRRLDREALLLVDEIRLNIAGRGARARVLAREYSFDVWDALTAETVLPLPKYFRSPHHLNSERDPAPQAFPRRYWARAVQGVIARYWAVEMWKRAVAGDDEVTFEEVLMGFSAFFGWSPYSLAKELDQAAENCRSWLNERHVVMDRFNREFDLHKVCEVLLDVMRNGQFNLTAHDPVSDEHLVALYPHALLTDEIDFVVSDLAKVWYLVAICRRLGLDAYPTLRSENTDFIPVCCIRPHWQGADDVPVIVAFSPAPSVIPVTESERYQQMVGIAASLPGGGGGPGLSDEYKSIAMLACAPPYKPSQFLVMALSEAGSGLGRYSQGDPDDWIISEKEKSILAAHAVQCLLAVHQGLAKPPDLVPGRLLAENCPLDGQVIMLDVLLAGAQHGTRAGEVADEMRKVVERSENVDALVTVRRRSCHPDRPDMPYVGRVITYDEHDPEEGFVWDWEVIRNMEGEYAGKPVLDVRLALPGTIDATRAPVVSTKQYVKHVGLTKRSARSLYIQWSHFGRYVEDVSFSEVDQKGDPMRLVMTAEMRTLYPEDGIPELVPYAA
ncbi:hypothetical protein C8Q76DRAFT_796170 [Earliella scabrosa]|nr:hypothetical protein C8Q76DRAFT_796170 [Earliella scabrosa]